MPQKNRPAKSTVTAGSLKEKPQSVSHSSLMVYTSNPAPVLASGQVLIKTKDKDIEMSIQHSISSGWRLLDAAEDCSGTPAPNHDHNKGSHARHDDSARTLGSLDSMGFSGFHGLGGIMAGFTHWLKNILNSSKAHGPGISTNWLVALQELAEILADEDEDEVALVAALTNGHGDASVEAPNPGGNVEQMLLALRCLANLMEALPGSAHTVVHHGAVPVLCA
ncbi:hypothetical protein PPACK8108_LOCUS5912 [Phakopsora pachyrhizi]|uniref:E3 ubiquitin-protein ligase TRIP12-like TPR repeats domain-containing protein n=1 Tax=Phakopsora pachyrhizi TaxID=170000 RepID=A0AAV0ARU0_PHAPC|nr:hypothetical protein PPACK8108_LOCUS5912 [Phakopsora pachyrhizi]